MPEIDPFEFSCHQTHCPNDDLTTFSLHIPALPFCAWLHSSLLFPSHSSWPIAAPYQQPVLSAIISFHHDKIPGFIWWQYLGSCVHLEPVIVVTGLECSDRLGTWMETGTSWPESIGDISITKQEEMDDGQKEKRKHVLFLLHYPPFKRWWN